MAKVTIHRNSRIAASLLAFVPFFIAGLAVSRLLFEAAFPQMLGLSRPVSALILATLSGLVGWFAWWWANRRLGQHLNQPDHRSLSVWTCLPLLLNLTYLFDPTVDLIGSRLMFAASVWLSALFVAQALLAEKSWSWAGMIFVLAALLPIYLISMPQTVGSADTFEFQVVIPQLGIAHPTGYPLYLLLGRLFAYIPLGTMAWRVNLASAVFTLLAMVLLYAVVRRLVNRPVPSVLAVVILGLTPVVWSQAVEAEVYALHALIITAVLWLMIRMLDRGETADGCSGDLMSRPLRIDWQRAIVVLAFFIGLGLTNHLTTLFLLPPAILAVLLAYGRCLRQHSIRENVILFLKTAAALLLPLLLYAYLPVRWFALHEEAMGIGRFVDWVIGGRFQGALQLSAWLSDLMRYQVVGRLFLQNWGWLNLLLIGVGLLYIAWRNWRAAVVLMVTLAGFTFYALNYYVPDLAVFIIPAHVIMVVFWGAGVTAVLDVVDWLTSRMGWLSLRAPLTSVLIILLLLPSLNRLSGSWSAMTGKENDQLLAWGEGVLALPLDNEAAILADSEKIAPLYYLQQAEGVRPDLDIMVLPDEAAYRSELDGRLNTEQAVYLARYLPGLEGIYHLRSLGPLVEVSQNAITVLPQTVEEQDIDVGPVKLIGLDLRERSSVDPQAAEATLYWQSETELAEPLYIYMRWAGEDFATSSFTGSGQHPAGNSYPTNAWQSGEIVPDFHLLSFPPGKQGEDVDLQVAVGPAFQSTDELAWVNVHKMTLPPALDYEVGKTLRAQNGRVLLSGVDFPAKIRPGKPLPVVLTGYGSDVAKLQLHMQAVDKTIEDTTDLEPSVGDETAGEPFAYAVELDTDLPNGRYYLLSQDSQAASICGWLERKTSGCILGEVEISGTALPEGAVSFADKIALLEVDLPQRELVPGGRLPVHIQWQGMSAMDEDFTVFIQVLDAQDRIMGQVDAWPLQGTFPTSEWAVGQTVEDPYLVQLADDIPAGEYRLQIGWYLLSTLQRLSVMDEDGQAADNKLVIGNLSVSE